MKKILIVFLLLPLFSFAQLKEFEVSEMERPDVAVVQANGQWPDDALLLVYSSLKDLNFRSSLGGIDKVSYNPQSNRYEILFRPHKQMLFVYASNFVEQKIETFNPNAKDVFYYSVEISKEHDLESLREAVDSLRNQRTEKHFPNDSGVTSPDLHSSMTQKLLNLKKLFDAGVITKSEYDVSAKQFRTEILQESALVGSVQMPTELGQLYEGGIVFELKKDGHGLVVALEDLGKLNWEDAKKQSEIVELRGYSDWYLPSKKELKKLYQSFDVVNNGLLKAGGEQIERLGFWSSTDFSENTAWLFYFSSGRAVDYYYKHVKHYARPVRAF